MNSLKLSFNYFVIVGLGISSLAVMDYYLYFIDIIHLYDYNSTIVRRHGLQICIFN